MIRRSHILIFLTLLLLVRGSLYGISNSQADTQPVTNAREALQEALLEKGLTADEAKDLVCKLSDEEAIQLAQDQGLIDSAGLRGKFVVTFIIAGLIAGAVAATLLLAEETDTE